MNGLDAQLFSGSKVGTAWTGSNIDYNSIGLQQSQIRPGQNHGGNGVEYHIEINSRVQVIQLEPLCAKNCSPRQLHTGAGRNRDLSPQGKQHMGNCSTAAT